MKFILSLILFISSFTSINAQSFIVLHNGDKIEFEKFKSKNDKIIITQKDKKETIELNSTDVYGYYNPNGMAFNYLKLNNNNSSDFQFVSRMVEGKINVYQRLETSYSYGMVGATPQAPIPSTSRDLYMEKGDKYLLVYPRGALTDKRKFEEQLIDFVDGDPELVQQIESQDFRYSYLNVLNIARQYNIKAYEPIEPAEITERYIYLGRQWNKQTKKPAIVIIDGKEYQVKNNLRIKVKVPVNKLVMICVKGREKDACDLITASEYVNKSYEISLTRQGEASIIYEVFRQ